MLHLMEVFTVYMGLHTAAQSTDLQRGSTAACALKPVPCRALSGHVLDYDWQIIWESNCPQVI